MRTKKAYVEGGWNSLPVATDLGVPGLYAVDHRHAGAGNAAIGQFGIGTVHPAQPGRH